MNNEDIKKIRRNDEAVWRVIDDEVVVLIPGERALHALRGCGSRVWELIDGETTIAEIIQQICTEYEVEPQKAREEINEYVSRLAAINLVDIMPVTGEEIKR